MSLVNSRNSASGSAAPSLTIERIEVRDHFGIYSYDLELDPGVLAANPNLMILYGDNGSGKTTILRLIFNLLSPEDRAGHRSYLARTSFKESTGRTTMVWNVREQTRNYQVIGSSQHCRDGLVLTTCYPKPREKP
jgi:ABC-type uncharacterized transport system ATPase subunit